MKPGALKPRAELVFELIQVLLLDFLFVVVVRVRVTAEFRVRSTGFTFLFCALLFHVKFRTFGISPWQFVPLPTPHSPFLESVSRVPLVLQVTELQTPGAYFGHRLQLPHNFPRTQLTPVIFGIGVRVVTPRATRGSRGA